MTARAAGMLAEFVAEEFKALEQARRVLQRQAAGGGQDHAPRAAFEQLRAGGGLEIRQASAGRGQGQVAMARTLGDAAALRHGAEQTQVTKSTRAG